MFLNHLHYELKLAWKSVILLPLVALVVILLFTVLQLSLHQSPAHVWLAAIEMVLPLAAGIVTTAVIAHDSALELQLTMPRKYRTTGLLRVAIIFVWTAALALLCLAYIALSKMFYPPNFTRSWYPVAGFLVLQLLWLSPLLWFMTAGLCFALLTQGRTASGTLLGMIWLLSIIFVGVIASVNWLRPFLFFPATLVIYPATRVPLADFNSYWLTTRFELLGMALVFLAIGWLLLYNTERLLKGSTEE